MNRQSITSLRGLLLSLLLLAPALCCADPGNNYCVTPAFITASIKPNLLLMIDNSASMYDLTYVDRGKKHCAVETTKNCLYDSDCTTAGDTCSVFDRQPYYCYDETFSSSTTYAGYFDSAKYYYYRPGNPVSEGDFAELADFAGACPGNAGETVKAISGNMCVQYVSASGTLTKFAAKGNYLNWLTASKLDVEKKILTGGKWDGTGLLAESRGCVGQGYVKNVMDADFVNFSGSATNDGNTPLGVTFTVTGPSNANNASAPSSGGTTYINLYAGKAYRYADCQAAVNALATGGNADIKQTVAACLTSDSPASGYCQQNGTQACTTSSNCYRTGSSASYVCSAANATSCSGLTDDTSCRVAARSACSLNSTLACTVDSDCQTSVAEKLGTCGNYTPTLANNATPPSSCRTNANCSFSKANKNYTGTCSGYVAASSANNGTCASTPASNFGPCVANYTGPCVLPGGTALVKTKVSFQQSMQACWALRNGHAIGTDDINTVKNQCSDVYGSYATCSNNHFQTCSTDANCPGGTCQSGPDAIAPGNPALLCGETYEGQFYTKNSSSAWVLKDTATTQAMIDVHTQFCKDMGSPNVTDPTDAPSDTTVTDSLPAIISGVGVEAQVGPPVGRMRVKLATASAPTGLVQQFGNQIRLGALSFNQYGSASEAGLTGVHAPKVCSDDASISCTQNVDCASKSCVAASNLDGGKIILPIGLGVCATMNGSACLVNADCTGGTSCLNNYCGTKGTTVCTTVANCSGASQACIPNDVGAHGPDTLTRALDDIPANSWTPLSEAYYNAIGYFAQIASGADAGKSRTALRLNSIGTTSTNFDPTKTPAPPVDFNENLNPSEFRCQQNYTLLISDGSSTADRNPTVNALASLYANQAGITQTTCTGASGGSSADYGGTNNLPIMTWLAKNRNISDFNLAGSASTAAPVNARDSFTSYVVFNGETNGAAGDCNSLTLLSKAASKGGTTIKQAGKPEELQAALTAVFTDVAAKAASGTAASILSNSEGSGANIMQAVFYPKKIFDNSTSANWIGEMQNLWYFIDPYINNSTIREDSDGPAANGDVSLNLVNDKVVRFTFDTSSNKTLVQLYTDSDGNGTGDAPVGGLIDPDLVQSIWRSGRQLWSRDLTLNPRTIYTSLISGATGVAGTGLMKFSWNAPDNSSQLQPYLQAASADETLKIMRYVHGFDYPGDTTMRNRTVQSGSIPSATVSSDVNSAYVTNPRDKGIGVWKLGDIISSTPRVQSTVRLGTYNLGAPGGYNDQSYLSFINSSEYQNRGMVYVGANDGMLHAFNLGVLSVKASGFTKATLSGTNRGEESWAYIPKQFLPFLKYSQDPAYQHIYAVDGRTLLVDASIGDTGAGSCVKDSYWMCSKPTSASVVTSTNHLDSTKNTWRTIVIGGMGLGGASAASAGTNNVAAPIADPADASKALGYSSYFALDVTDPANPKLLWEFNDPGLGYATSSAAVVRLGGSQNNGRWFAIFGSGPTGPIENVSHQFLGRSNQHLKFFVVDLRTGDLVKTIDTGIDQAFAGSLTGGAIDTDRWDPTVTGNYQDDAVYVGYVKKASSGNSWTDGGVGRIMIDQVADPSDANIANVWHWTTLIDGIGPVTSSIARLQDKKNRNLWLYGGTGRYYFRDSIALDDHDGQRMIFGIKDPCYNKGNIGNYLDCTCSDSVPGGLVNQTSSISALAASNPGWRIDLDSSSTATGAERLVTDSVALVNGTVYFTSFAPTMDACGYGGNSFLWGVKYDTGDAPPAKALTGKALIQLSTGEFKEVDLSTAFTDKLNRRMTTPLTGKPPSDAPPIISSSSNKPVKKILHIQEH